ncbi:hypothetical protein Pmani_004525 [Petrolisthes manimaculis]|uniref:Ionotropic glutamate receptor C-terminal domain-containing protein n=1 Tax=Petrolisthes manimaculis TaxID=1843537 RepID=A0AAE1UN78_9EUCA|nr:hypothetical protein Pmani_004525 [Petrolisthes manimaculis]
MSVFLEVNSPARTPGNLTARLDFCVTQLVNERVSYICPNYHILMPVRFQQHDFTFSYEFSYFSFAMAKPSLKTQWQSLYYPLDGLVWLLVLLMLLCTPLFLIMVSRGGGHQQYLSSSDGMGVSVVMQDMTGMLLGQNLPSRLPVTTSSRILVAAWLVFALILGLAYRGNLTASLTIPKFPPRIESLAQLVIGVDRVNIPPYGEQHRKFYSESDSPLFQALARVLEVGPSVHQGLTAANEKNEAQLGGRRFLSYQIVEGFTDVAGNTELYLGQETLFPGQAGWPIPHDAPFKHHLDRCIMASIEDRSAWHSRTSKAQEVFETNRRDQLANAREARKAAKSSLSIIAAFQCP